MVRIFESLVFLIFFLFFIQGLRAQYVNADSLVLLPGEELPLPLVDFYSLMEEFPADELPAGQEFLYGQMIPAGTLLKHFALPCEGKVISRYGWRSGRMHTGTDLKMDRGDTIYAAFQGTVTRAKYFHGYGNMVVVDHGNSLETSYAHLVSFLVKPGEEVQKMQPVGLAGSTGRASTNHLHFELREAGRHFDPELVYDFQNGSVRQEAYAIRNLVELLPDKKQAVYAIGETAPESYIVAEGDSLWKISRRYKTSVKALCRLNDLNENSVLNVGMVLKLF